MLIHVPDTGDLPDISYFNLCTPAVKGFRRRCPFHDMGCFKRIVLAVPKSQSVFQFVANFAFLNSKHMDFRIEKDTMGEVKVPADAYYGAQTQRSIDNFKIARDTDRMPKEIIRAFAYLKKAAALTNLEAGVLPKEKSDLIGKVCDEILEGRLDAEFPL